jgi:hypothetical protein
VTSDGVTPLHLASFGGHTACVQWLLSKASSAASSSALAAVDAGRGWTPLLYAAAGGHASCFRALLAAGAKSDVCDAEGRTAAHLAAASADGAEVLAALADSSLAHLTRRDSAGLTPLHYACAADARFAAAVILARASATSASGSSSSSSSSCSIKSLLRVRDSMGRTPAEVAGECGAAGTLVLLRAWASSSSSSSDGNGSPSPLLPPGRVVVHRAGPMRAHATWLSGQESFLEALSSTSHSTTAGAGNVSASRASALLGSGAVEACAASMYEVQWAPCPAGVGVGLAFFVGGGKNVRVATASEPALSLEGLPAGVPVAVRVRAMRSEDACWGPFSDAVVVGAA